KGCIVQALLSCCLKLEGIVKIKEDEMAELNSVINMKSEKLNNKIVDLRVHAVTTGEALIEKAKMCEELTVENERLNGKILEMQKELDECRHATNMAFNKMAESMAPSRIGDTGYKPIYPWEDLKQKSVTNLPAAPTTTTTVLNPDNSGEIQLVTKQLKPQEMDAIVREIGVKEMYSLTTSDMERVLQRVVGNGLWVRIVQTCGQQRRTRDMLKEILRALYGITSNVSLSGKIKQLKQESPYELSARISTVMEQFGVSNPGFEEGGLVHRSMFLDALEEDIKDEILSKPLRGNRFQHIGNSRGENESGSEKKAKSDTFVKPWVPFHEIKDERDRLKEELNKIGEERCIQKGNERCLRMNVDQVQAHRKETVEHHHNNKVDKLAKEAAEAALEWPLLTAMTSIPVAAITRAQAKETKERTGELAKLQEQDEEIGALRKSCEAGPIVYEGQELYLKEGLLVTDWKDFPVWFAPKGVRKDILTWIHGSPVGGHPKLQLASERLDHVAWWPQSIVHMEDHIQSCLECARHDPTNRKRRGALMRQVERMNRTVKDALKKVVNSQGTDWDEKLPFVLSTIRSRVCRSTGFAPYEALLGRTMRTWEHLLNPLPPALDTVALSEAWVGNLKEHILTVHKSLCATDECTHKATQKWFNAKGDITEHQIGDRVMLQDFSPHHPFPKPKWKGPYFVLDKIGPSVYLLDVGDENFRWTHACQIKAFRGKNDVPS
ncbi:marginal coil Xmc L homeolog, partial [Pelobates cultripes]